MNIINAVITDQNNFGDPDTTFKQELIKKRKRKQNAGKSEDLPVLRIKRTLHNAKKSGVMNKTASVKLFNVFKSGEIRLKDVNIISTVRENKVIIKREQKNLLIRRSPDNLK